VDQGRRREMVKVGEDELRGIIKAIDDSAPGLDVRLCR
jgi:hypothetical protein